MPLIGFNPKLIIWALFVVLVVLLLWLFSDILLPFVAGMAVAYLLDPVADKLESWGLSRAIATSLITLVFFIVMVAATIMLVPLVEQQVRLLVELGPQYSQRGANLLEIWTGISISQIMADLRAGEGFTGEVMRTTANAVSDFVRIAIDRGIAFFNLLSLLVITPIVSFYLLLDWDHMIARIRGWLPRDHEQVIVDLAMQIDRVMSGFIRGTGMVCMALGLFYALALTLLGLQFGFVVGLIAGLVSFVPFLGFIVGLVLSGILAVLQFWPDGLQIAMVLGVFLVGQALEGNFLTPRLVGKNVGLHPVWVIFALLAFGLLFGFVGILLAVPIAAALGVLVRFGIGVYLDSDLYLGKGVSGGQVGFIDLERSGRPDQSAPKSDKRD